MLQDSTNTQLLDTYENNYQTHMNKEDKRGYREASITLFDTREVNDSVAIIKYSNSFKKQKDSLRVVHGWHLAGGPEIFISANRYFYTCSLISYWWDWAVLQEALEDTFARNG